MKSCVSTSWIIKPPQNGDFHASNPTPVWKLVCAAPEERDPLSAVLYTVVSLLQKVFFLKKSLHQMNQEKSICSCFPGFLVWLTQTQHLMHFLVGLSRALCELPSESKTKQITCLSKDLSSCPLLAFYSLLSFCAPVMLYIFFLCLYGCWGCFQKDILRWQRN